MQTPEMIEWTGVQMEKVVFIAFPLLGLLQDGRGRGQPIREKCPIPVCSFAALVSYFFSFFKKMKNVKM